MFDFAKLCKEYENLSDVERGVLLAENAIVVVAKLKALDLPVADPVGTLVTFIMGAVVADGKVDEAEYVLLLPALVAAFGDDFDYESVKRSVKEDAEGRKQLTKTAKDLSCILGLVDDDLKAEIVSLCLCVVSVDEKISLRERNYIKQIIKA